MEGPSALMLDLSEDNETLDEDEFDIPKYTLPTLESILAEPDDNTSTLGVDDLSLSNLVEEGSVAAGSSLEEYRPPELDVLKNWETTSIASNESRPTRSERGSKSMHGCVLALNRMTILSESLKTSMAKINTGRPTVLAVSSMIAVGTSRGVVLLFDQNQKLKACLGNVDNVHKYGGVSALEFNTDVTRMLVGHSKGAILMYDITNSKLLRTITDATPPGTAVLHVKFTDDLTLAICNDSGGSVFELNFRRVMGVRTCESRCIFSGSRGEVCTIEPLHLTQSIADHPARERHLLAMGTLTKVFVIALRPKTEVVFTHRLNMNPTSAPLLSWKLMSFKRATDQRYTVDPVLMFARGDVVYFFHAKFDGKDGISFVHLRTMNLTYKLINLAWINSGTVLLVDVREQLHVVDVDSQQDLETKATGDQVRIVYSNATFKSIATGGNVSAALATVGEHACYHSIISNCGTVYLLGVDSGVFAASLNNWKDRVSIALAHTHQYALTLALTFYNGTARAVIGLPSDKETRRQLVSDLILEILIEFVDLSMTSLCPDSGKLQVLIDFYRNVVPVCVDHCLHIDRTDVLFTRIYERFRDDCIAHGAFLECLEPYITNDRLPTINPQVMKDFIEHYQAKNMLESIEKCLLHLNVESLDLNQVMHMCWAYGLYDAIISIHSRGMSDFITPFVELLLMLQSALGTGNPLSDKLTTLGNKLLVYMSSCLAGAAYPTGRLDEDASVSVKDQMFECITTPQMSEKGLEGSYPVITTLLHFSTKELLNVLSLNFAEDYFRGDSGCSKVQCVVDILLQVMVENQGFTPDQVGSLFTFLARQSARQNSPLHLSELLRRQVVEFLTAPADSATDHEEKQQALVELLECGILNGDDDDCRMVELAEQASFYRVLKILHHRQRRFHLVFLAHLRDTSHSSDAFEYAALTMKSYDKSEAEKRLMRETVTAHARELIRRDGARTARLFVGVLNGSVGEIAASLDDDKPLLYDFLRAVFSAKSGKPQSGASALGMSMESYYGDDDEDCDLSSSSSGGAGNAPSPSSPYPKDPELCELYLELMCRFEGSRVLEFVQECDVLRPRQALDIVLRHGADDASAYLLERNGEVNSAFNILLGVCKEQLGAIDHHRQSPAAGRQAVSTSVNKLIRFCQRNSKKLNEKQREKLWFGLLDAALEPQSGGDEVEFFKDLARTILNSMIGYMSLSTVLQKIIQDPAYKGGEFSEIRRLLIGMLDTYRYEKTLIGTTLHMLSRDRYKSLSQLRTSITHGIAPRSQFCSICRQPLLLPGSHLVSEAHNSMVVFRNGTQYHERCFKRAMSINNPAVVGSSASLPHSTFEKDKSAFESWKQSPEDDGGLVRGVVDTNNQSKPSSSLEQVRQRSKSKLRTSSFVNDFQDKRFQLKIKAPSIAF